jgi:taurine dioxygenase
MTDDDLVRVTGYFGAFGREPFFKPMEGSDHVVALTRRADEKAPVFAENWHVDWSFEESPPIGTCLYSLVIPPVGGDTCFVNQQKALEEMPVELRSRLEGKRAIHTAAGAYAPDGFYGDREEESDRSIEIIFSEEARDRRSHPLIQIHPESGHETLYGCMGYIVGFEDTDEEEGRQLLTDLYAWQTREEFQYRHKWQERMFVIWDNRCLLHRANGGYDGYDRILHRTTVRPDPARYLAA